MAFSGHMNVNKLKNKAAMKLNSGPKTSLKRSTVALPLLKLNRRCNPNKFVNRNAANALALP